jgi:hypothetical protein
MGELIPIIAIIMGCSIPISKIWADHQRKMLLMQLEMRNQGDSGLRAEVEALRQEVRSLRDTSTQYDLSFDTALQRLEKRIEGVERRGGVNTPETNSINVGLGR